MTTVLITRPRAASERLAQVLQRHGFQNATEPLLVIEALETPMPDINSLQAIMITSANAIEALAASEYAINGLLNLPCFCVGPKTGEEAGAFGFRDIRNSRGGGAELARLIGDVLKDRDKTILHIAAEDADSKAQTELEHLGYKLIVWHVYAARPISRLSEPTIRLLLQQKLDAVLVFSVRTAQVLAALLEQEGLRACCASVSAIGLSAAVADTLRPLPWRKLTAAEAPTEEAMIECLKRLHPVS